jgi:hypothetical protein
VADHIEGWWTIGEAPNYEVNDDGVVRHKESGRPVKRYGNPEFPQVKLSTRSGVIGRGVRTLVETGRKYQGVDNGRTVGEDSGSPDLRSEYRRKS